MFTPEPKKSISALRYDPDGSHHWMSYTLDEQIAFGGAATIWSIAQSSNPTLLLKIFKPDQKDFIKKNAVFVDRLIPLAQHRDDLLKTLPFCAWPRRLLFRSANLDPATFVDDIAGFSMATLDNSKKLSSILFTDRARLHITPQASRHIAITIADQLDRMHNHPWQFVFGDLSPNNIHIGNNLQDVFFLDTDAFQYKAHLDGHDYAFPLAGVTDGYTSPARLAGLPTDYMQPAHDDFVLAILILQLYMADLGITDWHPLQMSGRTENQNITDGYFPLNAPGPLKVQDYVVEKYRSIPAPLRNAFENTFTHKTKLTARQWRGLCEAHWGLL